MSAPGLSRFTALPPTFLEPVCAPVAPFILVATACDALRAEWLAVCKTLEASKLEGKKRTAELVLDPVDAVTQPEAPTIRADTKIRLLSSSAFAYRPLALRETKKLLS